MRRRTVALSRGKRALLSRLRRRAALQALMERRRAVEDVLMLGGAALVAGALVGAMRDPERLTADLEQFGRELTAGIRALSGE